MPATSAASSALHAGTISFVKPGVARAEHHRQNAADRLQRAVEREFAERDELVAARRRSICSSIAISASAIARSNAGPSLRTSAGERLTSSRPAG